MYDSQNLTVALSRIQNEKIKNEEDRTGFYRAVVVDNKDPLNVGRVRIRIPSFHGASSETSYYITDDELPFAYPACLPGAGYKMGTYILPKVGSLVWVSFETGTLNFVYFGGIYTADPTGNRFITNDRTVSNGEAIQVEEDDISSNYNANRYVLFKTYKGAEIVIDERDYNESVEIKDSHGNKIRLDSDGVSIDSSSPLIANFPYLTTYYIDVSDIELNNIEFDVGWNKVFPTKEMNKDDWVTPIVGGKVVYLDDGVCVGTGFVTQIAASKRIVISTNGLINYDKLMKASLEKEYIPVETGGDHE